MTETEETPTTSPKGDRSQQGNTEQPENTNGENKENVSPEEGDKQDDQNKADTEAKEPADKAEEKEKTDPTKKKADNPASKQGTEPEKVDNTKRDKTKSKAGKPKEPKIHKWHKVGDTYRGLKDKTGVIWRLEILTHNTVVVNARVIHTNKIIENIPMADLIQDPGEGNNRVKPRKKPDPPAEEEETDDESESEAEDDVVEVESDFDEESIARVKAMQAAEDKLHKKGIITRGKAQFTRGASLDDDPELEEKESPEKEASDQDSESHGENEEPDMGKNKKKRKKRKKENIISFDNGLGGNTNPIIQVTADTLKELFRGTPRNNTDPAVLALLKSQAQASDLTNSLLKKSINQDEADDKPATQSNIVTQDMQIKPMKDDMHRNLCPARFFPISTDFEYSQTLVPKNIAPVRTNYNLAEYGIVVTQFKPVIRIHDRAATNLQLKNYTHANLAKVESNKAWEFHHNKITMADEDKELMGTYEALSALLNFTTMTLQACPSNMEALQLMNAVYNTHFQRILNPTAKDIAELFVKWNLERSQNITSGKPIIMQTRNNTNIITPAGKVITYRWITDTLKDIVNSRRALGHNVNRQIAELKTKLSDLGDDPNLHKKHRDRDNQRNTGPRTRDRDRDRKTGRGTPKRTNQNNTTPPPGKRPRGSKGPAFCREFNAGNCSRPVTNGQCFLASINRSLLHRCDHMDQQLGLRCGQDHPRTGNH